MGTKINFVDFLQKLDDKLKKYFLENKESIFCCRGCSFCCENGDYPVSNIELEYLMQGYSLADNNIKKTIQENIKTMEKGGRCPFLINRLCSVYKFRPIVCRVHGLAYLLKNDTVKVPYCANEGKNFNKQYNKGEFIGNPIREDLETYALLEEAYGKNNLVIKNLYEWFHTDSN